MVTQQISLDLEERELITPTNITKVEQYLLQNANNAIISISTAIAKWESSKDKEKLAADFEKHKKFLHEIEGWTRNTLILINQEAPFEERIKNLQEFAVLCYQKR